MFDHINRNWSLGRRMTVIAMTGLAPIAFSLAIMVLAQWQTVTTAQSELNGLRLQNAIWRDVAGGEKTTSAELRGLAADFKALGAEKKYNEYIAADKQVAKAKAAKDLLVDVTSRSELALDPEAASYYIMETVSIKLPNLHWQLTEFENATNGSPEQIVGADAILHTAIIGHKVTDMLGNIEYISNLEGLEPVKAALEPHASILNEASSVHAELEDHAPTLTNSQLRAKVQPLRNDMQKLQQEGSALLADLLNNRINRAYWSIGTYLLGALITVALGTFLCFNIVAGLSRSLHHQLGAIDKISHEDEAAEILYTDYNNETGELAQALARLKAGVIERKRLAEETKRQVAEKEATNEFYVLEHEKFMNAFHVASEKLATGVFSYRITAKVIDEYAPIVEEMNKTFERLDAVQVQIKTADQQRDSVIAAFGQSLSRLADGDLRARIEIEVSEQFQRLKVDFNSALDQLEATLTEVKSGTDAIKVGTDEISQASDDLSRRTESQAASLEETAAAVGEITGTVRKTAEGAREAHEVVAHAKKDAERSGEVVRRAIEAMSAIENSSKQISQIIGVIDEIAFQTNLLALNAGVEAARAGEAGRGFAVVASEVRALAQRSAEAAKEIKGLISASTTQVAQGVELVGETGQTLTRIVERVSQINQVVSEIASSANEQAQGLSQVNTAVGQMDQATQQNAAMAEEATAATRNLQQQTEILAQLVSRFRTSREVAPAARHERKTAASPRAPAARRAAPMKATGTHGFAHAASDNSNWEEF